MACNISKSGASPVSSGINEVVVDNENMSWATKTLCFVQQRASTENCTPEVSGFAMILWYHFLW